jgi:Holliday junction resolvase
MSYASGVKFEYFIRDFYMSQGHVVIRAAGSHGPVDLIAFNGAGAVMVQCKKEKKSRGTYAEDVRALAAVDAPEDWKRYVMIKRKKDIIVVDARKGTRTVIPVKSFIVSKVCV